MDNISFRDGYWNVIRKVEEHLLRAAHEEARGNRAEAARLLSIHRRLLYQKMEEYGIR
ncbi:MAG: hypothetical protein DMG09_10790 [Acidobacteria bacterium]|nr:MAG: hypothetical protein DMG09_10790 [Acidobacteriota bacterium]